MYNKFEVVLYRFHMKKKNTLLIKGYFEEGCKKNNSLKIMLDQKELNVAIDEEINQGIALSSELGTSRAKYIYELQVELPGNWEKGQKIRVINCLNEKEKEEYKISVAKLVKNKKRIEKYVECEKVSEKGFVIKGWCIYQNKVDIIVKDEKKNILPVKIKEKKRVDVFNQYPECTEEDVYGFEIVYKGNVPKVVYVYLEEGNKSAKYGVTLKASVVKKGVNKVKRYKDKGMIYLKKYGIKDVFERVEMKLSRKNHEMYEYWRRLYVPTKKQLKEQSEQAFEIEPKISIVVPLYKTDQRFLKEMIDSVKGQSYSNWELCLSDGSGNPSPLKDILTKYENEDKRIKVIRNDFPLQISDNTNKALELVSGDWVAFMDHDDLLTPDAFYECVKAINQNENVDMIYTDEDKISMDGKIYFQPHFKSDFNIDMLRGTNYFCHLTVVKKGLYEKAGNLNGEFDGAQDYDFVLRCVEHAKNVVHIPKVLYHWRAHKDSTAENPESKLYAFEAGARAVQAHYDRVGINAKVESTKYLGIYRSTYQLQEKPLISIIIPNKDHIEDLDKCITSIEMKSTYKNVEYIIVENNSEEERTFEYYKKMEAENPKVKVVKWEKEFNYSAINNFGVTFAKGDYYLFLNNDTEIINENCLEEMMGYCLRNEVGAVGARLYYEDGTIQHAGVIVGLQGVAGHVFTGLPHDTPGYFGRVIIAHDCSAVTAACMLVKKEAFEKVNGFDPDLAVAFNDIDFCLKIREAGYLIVYNPYAELYHYESKSRGMEDNEKKIKRFMGEIKKFHEKWFDILYNGDPYYNPNLTLLENNFDLRHPCNKRV